MTTETSTVPPEVPPKDDSVDVLKSILGFHEEQTNDKIEIQDNFDFKPDDLKAGSLEEIRFLHSVQSIQNVEDEKLNLTKFTQTTDTFDHLITSLSQYLVDFNSKLIQLSKDLETLKSKSINYASSLTQRQNLEQKYIPIVSDLIIPPEIVKSIYNGDITPNWCENLQFLNDKLQIITKYDNKLKSLDTLKSLLKQLELRAIERIKNYIVTKIKKLRIIGTPSQVIQQDLIKVKEIFPYLSLHQPSLVLELRTAYIYTMKWYYHAHFQRYLQSLERLNLYKYQTKDFLIGGASQSSFFKNTKTNISDYSIGKRFNIIKAEDPTVLLAQIAENNPVKFEMETGFRSFNLALIDNGSVEYLFLIEFWKLSGNDANATIEQIFTPTYQLGIQYTKELILNTFDIFGILILIRLSQSLNFELQKRRIPVIEDYFNLQSITLWPKFQHLIDLNVENMKRSSLRSSSIAQINLKSPHPLTIQFTNLLYGFLKLSIEGITTEQEPLIISIQRLNNEFESALTKLTKTSKNVESILHINYSYIYTILSELDGDFAKGQADHFKKLSDAYKS